MNLTAEQQAVLRSIRQLVDFWQISAHELASDDEAVRLVAQPELPPKGPKYRHPVSGETWDGEGSQPQWLRDALIREGYLVEELRIAT